VYAECGDMSLAYQVFGDGAINFVFAGSFVSHVELWWGIPETKAFFDRLSAFCRVLIFDKAGVGLSDPVTKVRTIDERAQEIEAVMDAAGFESHGARKTIKVGPFRFTVSGSGVTGSAGGKGYRISRSSSGRRTSTLRTPGTGISWRRQRGR